VTILAPSLEIMSTEFRARRGLYVLGAGASSGISPIGQELAVATGVDSIRRGSFSVIRARPTILTGRVTKHFDNGPPVDIFGNRELRPGTEDFPYRAAISRLTDQEAQWRMRNRLAGIKRKLFDNYRVFRLLHSSLIMSYNLDGVASSALCGRHHRLLTPHGVIAEEFGSTEIAKILSDVRSTGWPGIADDVLMCIPESDGDEHRIKHAWLEAGKMKPSFIAIIGYSFGRDGRVLDDHFSFEYFRDVFRGFAGNVYVIDPNPDFLHSLVADALKSHRIYAVRALWNVLAHAIIEDEGRRSLYRACEELRARWGDRQAFHATLDG
jgi:hypothetical protein